MLHLGVGRGGRADSPCASARQAGRRRGGGAGVCGVLVCQAGRPAGCAGGQWEGRMISGLSDGALVFQMPSTSTQNKLRSPTCVLIGRIKGSGRLCAMQEIAIPCPPACKYSIQQGDTLSALAELYLVDEANLVALNPGIAPSALAIGQVCVSAFVSILECARPEQAGERASLAEGLGLQGVRTGVGMHVAMRWQVSPWCGASGGVPSAGLTAACLRFWRRRSTSPVMCEVKSLLGAS